MLGGDEDSTDLHLADTLAAGAGLCDTDAVRVLVDEGPWRVHQLIAMGAVFDRQPGGALALAREGGHSTARVVHAGGAATGAEVERALVEATRTTAAAVLEQWFALDLLVEGGRCRGVRALSADGQIVEVRATHTVLATGGAGQLFAVTTNPAEATADGLAMALRAGVPVADVEFMQFHPTALHHPAMPRPLLSEALRGHGALLRDGRGERFVDELAPRDVVSRAMADRMRLQGAESLWLDATGLAAFDSRFPTIAASLRAIGLDPAHDWLPIAPAAHYLSGGVLTDLSGATALPGCGPPVRWPAPGCTGPTGWPPTRSSRAWSSVPGWPSRSWPATRDRPPPAPWVGSSTATVRRSTRRAPPGRRRPELPPAAGGRTCGGAVAGRDQSPRPAAAGDDRGGRRGPQRRVARHRRSWSPSRRHRRRTGDAPDCAHGELANLATAAASLLRSAELRCETRGAHARSDHPRASERWRRRIVHTGDGVILVGGPPPPHGNDRPGEEASGP